MRFQESGRAIPVLDPDSPHHGITERRGYGIHVPPSVDVVPEAHLPRCLVPGASDDIVLQSLYESLFNILVILQILISIIG